MTRVMPRSLRPRRGLVLLLVATLLPLSVGGALARDERGPAGTREDARDKDRRRRAIQRGCLFLAGRPGSIHGHADYAGRQRETGAWGDQQAQVAITALCVLALMSDGSTDGRGPYGLAVKRGLNFLIGLVEARTESSRYPEGYFWHPEDSSSRMHGQGFATLALASALGTSKGDRARTIRAVLEKAVRCIEGAQADTGGFGYEPRPDNDHEGSVTVAVAQGLRAARDAGVLVNEQVIERGLRYLKRSQKKDGSFQYSLHQEQSSYALTAAALSSFFLYGSYKDDEDGTHRRAIQYLQEQMRTPEQAWYYYGHFYAAWAFWQHDGDAWDDRPGNVWGWWHHRVYPDLLERRQRSDGSFEEDRGRYDFGAELSTAFAILTLAIPDEQLPIFQR
jgi:hypothetical protein